MCINPDLVHRYMRATIDSMKAMLKIELEMGVYGILGVNGWCYRSGPMMSPKHFDEYMAPHLKEIVDLIRDYGRFYIRHLDGYTCPILDSLVYKCGIDACHTIESPSGMDIVKVKQMHGNDTKLLAT